MAEQGINITGSIGNKHKRQEQYALYKKEKAKRKRAKHEQAKKLEEELGAAAPPKQVPRTQDNTREVDDTVVAADDDEVQLDEQADAFEQYFSGTKDPKIMITTRPRPSKKIFEFIGDLLDLLPNAFYYPRKKFHVKEICGWAHNKSFTHVIVLAEKAKKVNRLLVSHLPTGPTALFKLSTVVLEAALKKRGNKTSHMPEILLNNFNTRLGHRVGRFLGSFFPHRPNFQGRQVVTFHNQRDFIFLRRHRYEFDSDTKCRLQEIGPRFTLKLKWLQVGTFDTLHGEYEWIHKRKQMDTSRRKFHL